MEFLPGRAGQEQAAVTRFHIAAALAAALAAAPAAGQAPQGVKPTGLSGPEMLDRADRDVVRMKQVLKQVLGRVEEARGEKDIVKLNCVNEKLTQIKGLLKVAEQADISLQEAVARKDEGADADFAKVGIARGKVDQLRVEAEECIGQLAYVVDERTQVEVEVPKDLPRSDVTDREPPPPPMVRPPAASTFQ
jgi:hypothetical protein